MSFLTTPGSVWIAYPYYGEDGPRNAENPKGNRWAQYVSLPQVELAANTQ